MKTCIPKKLKKAWKISLTWWSTKFGRKKLTTKTSKEKEWPKRKKSKLEEMTKRSRNLKSTRLRTGKNLKLDTLSRSLLLSTVKKWLELLDIISLWLIEHFWSITWTIRNFRKADLSSESTHKFLEVLQVVLNRKIRVVRRLISVMNLTSLLHLLKNLRIFSLQGLILFSQKATISNLTKFHLANACSQA